MTTMLKLGTRGSPLALVQARMTAAALCAAHGWADGAVEIVIVSTTGDRVQDRPLADIGGKALWTKELDAALLDRRIDIAVHSMKDVETRRPDGLTVAAMLPRADVRDRLIGSVSHVETLPKGARLGTSSPRRAAQALSIRPDLRIVPLRGNVDTRLGKVTAGEVEATLLAAAGLDRLGRGDVGSAQPVGQFLPAPGQGAVGIEARLADAATLQLLAPITCPASFAAVAAERAVLDALGGSCHSALAAYAEISDGNMHLRAEILTPDGRERVTGDRHFAVADAAVVAGELATELLCRASPALRADFGR